ncbi:hypothetical protein QR680_005503 [Steinernema hermaphroditum]|uniref:3-hydroxyanthranilate 3,4-dioxygenase n=1 Tax=Steinernema hermaphroditum TaxID=289476 RepID=A0AA39HUG5_9BILA|nr:hypothetical protein QR680_005503 [Steinernema hermaphroditum]
MAVVHGIVEWIEANKKDFEPPVCNKCMFSDQLKVFFVGGPNSRKDYHLEEGEELFYQFDGDMVLKVVENGEFKDVAIKQGEMFLLPGRVEHSPQRFEGTMGCVVERTRKPNEMDCLRYFCDSSKERLWERWVHLKDVVKDLPPLIKAFHSSEACKTGKPDASSFVVAAPFEPVARSLEKPVNLEKFIEEHLPQLEKGPVPVFDSAKYSTQVLLFGRGKHSIPSGEGETIVFQQRGSSKVAVEGKESGVTAFHISRVPNGKGCDLTVEEGVAVVVKMVA